jgi:hypothetical protein
MKIACKLGFLALTLSASVLLSQQPVQDQGDQRQRRGFGGREFRGTVGQITEISGSTLKIKLQDGSTGTITTTSDTRFRKDQQDAKLSDFKVGDNIMVRGQSSSEKVWTAQMVASAPSRAEMQARIKDAMGKTMVLGEVKSIDPPKLTITRTDGVEQTIEADENTSFRKGRGDIITLPDIKAGDTVFARGELKDGMFVPASVNVLDPEMARTIKEGGMMFIGGPGPRGVGGPQPQTNQQAAPQPAPK